VRTLCVHLGLLLGVGGHMQVTCDLRHATSLRVLGARQRALCIRTKPPHCIQTTPPPCIQTYPSHCTQNNQPHHTAVPFCVALVQLAPPPFPFLTLLHSGAAARAQRLLGRERQPHDHARRARCPVRALFAPMLPLSRQTGFRQAKV